MTKLDPQSQMATTLPVAFRCRDFGDGWILLRNEAPAQEYAKKTGAYLEPLYTGQQLAEVEARATVAEAMFAEVEAALDAKEIESGLTSDGNLWRFWSQKAKDVAAKLATAEARVADLEIQLDGALKGDVVPYIVLAKEMKRAEDAEERAATQWRLRREMEASRDTERAVATTAEAEAERLRALVEEAREALRPMAEVASDIPEHWLDGAQCVTMAGHFRAARSLRDRLGVEG